MAKWISGTRALQVKRRASAQALPQEKVSAGFFEQQGGQQGCNGVNKIRTGDQRGNGRADQGEPDYSERAVRTRGIRFTRGLRNADSQAQPQTYWLTSAGLQEPQVIDTRVKGPC